MCVAKLCVCHHVYVCVCVCVCVRERERKTCKNLLPLGSADMEEN